MSSSRRALPLIVILLVAFGSLGLVLAKGWAPALGLDLQGGVSVVFVAVEADGEGEVPGSTTTTTITELTTTTAPTTTTTPTGPTASTAPDAATTTTEAPTTTTEAPTTTTTTTAPEEEAVDVDQALDDAIEIIRNRVDSLGVAEPEILRQGNAIVVNLPGVTDRERALDIIGRTAELRFRPVLSIQPYVTPEQLEAATSTTTTAPGETTTTAPGGATTTTTAPETSDTTEGAVGDAATRGYAAALPAQETTTTAPPATTTTSPGATTTTAPGATTTTTTPGVPEDVDGCVLLGGTTPSEEDTLDATVVLPGDDSPDDPDDLPEFCYQLGPVPSDDSGYLVGGVVTNPEAQINNGEWGVALGIKGESLPLFNATASACYVGAPNCPAQDESGRGRVAIVLDGVVESAPAINEPSFSGSGLTISGNMSEGDARDLALVLRYGALPIELEAQTVQTVSATLGEDSLRAGLVAGLLGISLVFLYLFLYYRALGLVVVAGTLVWSALNYSVIAILGETRDLALSLAGVTGIVISVGVTVDAYVVYFERLKDEMRAGRTVRASIDRGFQRAFRTILAANVSSLIGAAFLFALTVGPVRGFAFFLGLSTVLGLVVAWFFTRPLMSLLGRTHLFTDHPILGVGRGLGAPGAAGGVAGSEGAG